MTFAYKAARLYYFIFSIVLASVGLLAFGTSVYTMANSNSSFAKAFMVISAYMLGTGLFGVLSSQCDFGYFIDIILVSALELFMMAYLLFYAITPGSFAKTISNMGGGDAIKDGENGYNIVMSNRPLWIVALIIGIISLTLQIVAALRLREGDVIIKRVRESEASPFAVVSPNPRSSSSAV
jgi:hypothetical protein